MLSRRNVEVWSVRLIALVLLLWSLQVATATVIAFLTTNSRVQQEYWKGLGLPPPIFGIEQSLVALAVAAYVGYLGLGLFRCEELPRKLTVSTLVIMLVAVGINSLSMLLNAIVQYHIDGPKLFKSFSGDVILLSLLFGVTWHLRSSAIRRLFLK